MTRDGRVGRSQKEKPVRNLRVCTRRVGSHTPARSTYHAFALFLASLRLSSFPPPRLLLAKAQFPPNLLDPHRPSAKRIRNTYIPDTYGFFSLSHVISRYRWNSIAKQSITYSVFGPPPFQPPSWTTFSSVFLSLSSICLSRIHI